MPGKAECSDCGLTFASDASFDRHRVGSFVGTGERRCLTVEEMKAGHPLGAIAKRHGSWNEYRRTPWHLNLFGHWSHLAPERPFPAVTGPEIPAVEAPEVAEGQEALPGLPGGPVEAA